jgi:hypothetical protein
MKTITMLLLLLGSITFTSVARAGELDVITLADGTILRGHVTQLKPGDHVELVLLDGRTESIAWSEMTSSVGPSFPCDLPYLNPGPGRVPLQVESPDPLRVSVIGLVDQVPVCSTTPCTIYVPPGSVSLSAAGDQTDPCPFNVMVPPNGGRVTLHPASMRKRGTGVALLIAGTALGIGGAAIAGVGSTMTHDPTLPGNKASYEDNSTPMYAMGGTLAAAGVGALISGIVLLSTNHASSELTSFDGSIHF